MKLIDKGALVAEIKRRRNDYINSLMTEQVHTLSDILDFIDTLEVKEVDTWHLQEKENIYDAVKGWSLQTFVCVMKDGTIQEFTGNLDEDCEGHIHVHVDGVNNDYDNVDDIVKWIELT